MTEANPITQLPWSQAPSAFHERIRFWAEYFQDRPYLFPGLGEGDVRGPLWNLDCFDCVTFVEQVLALALASGAEEFEPILCRIRYYQGWIAFDYRNHFMEADWVPHNAWLLESPLPAPREFVMGRRIDRGDFLVRQGGSLPPEFPPVETVLFPVIRPDFLAGDEAPTFPPVSLVGIVRPSKETLIGHVGFLFGADGLFFHASSQQGKTVSQPLTEYVAAHPKVVGVTLFPIRENLLVPGLRGSDG